MIQNTSKNSPNIKITVKKILNLNKTYEELRPFFGLFVHYFKFVSTSETEIKLQLKEIQSKTQQKLKEDNLFKELWTLRYVCSHIWFFDLKPPKSQTELSDELLVIDSALKSVVKETNKLDYLPWLKESLLEFVGGELDFINLYDLKKNFPNKLADKIPRIAFGCTEGRLGGELHDFVIELIMTTIQKDQKVFNLSDDVSLTEVEAQNIKKTIAEMNEARHKSAEDLINSL